MDSFYEYIMSVLYETFWNFNNTVMRFEYHDRAGIEINLKIYVTEDILI